jgi:hypothetical protein
MRRQIAPHLLSGGQQTVDSAGATLDFLVQHLISRNRPHLLKKNAAQFVISWLFLKFSHKKLNQITQKLNRRQKDSEIIFGKPKLKI